MVLILKDEKGQEIGRIFASETPSAFRIDIAKGSVEAEKYGTSMEHTFIEVDKETGRVEYLDQRRFIERSEKASLGGRSHETDYQSIIRQTPQLAEKIASEINKAFSSDIGTKTYQKFKEEK